MSQVPVRFVFATSLPNAVFHDVRLASSWSENGRWSSALSIVPMQALLDEEGCPCFEAIIHLDAAEIGRKFRWGVLLTDPSGRERWGIAAEIDRHDSRDQHRLFTLQAGEQTKTDRLTHCSHLGANKLPAWGGAVSHALRFSAWAPHARDVDVMFADPAAGYIGNDGTGIAASPSAITLKDHDGVWSAGPDDDPQLADFAGFVGRPYMFRITKDDGSIAYRSDLFARLQFGAGAVDPSGGNWSGRRSELDGAVSCSVLVDPDIVVTDPGPQGAEVPADRFWSDEIDPSRPLPTRVEDLVIYELHVGALNFARQDAGDLEDGIALILHLVDLGINAVELLPISEFREEANWGYATSHLAAVETSAGGRDALKRFVRECHRYGRDRRDLARSLQPLSSSGRARALGL